MKRLQVLLSSLLMSLPLLTQAEPNTPASNQERLDALLQESYQLQQTLGRQQRQISRQQQELTNTSQLHKKLDIISDRIQHSLSELSKTQPYSPNNITEVQKALLDSPKPSTRFLANLQLMKDKLKDSASLTTWSGQIEDNQKVEFIQLGRVALYYLTPDAQEGAVYHPSERNWRALPLSETMELIKARNMALRETPGDWLYLPLPESNQGEPL